MMVYDDSVYYHIDKENQKIFTSEKLKPVNLCLFSLKSTVNDYIKCTFTNMHCSHVQTKKCVSVYVCKI